MSDNILARVLDEPWVHVSYEGEERSGKHRASLCVDDDGCGLSDNGQHECIGMILGPSEDVACMRAYVAVLGKRALNAIRKNDGVYNDDMSKLLAELEELGANT